MMEAAGALMVVAGGMFAGGAVSFSWSRVPIWRAMPVAQFGDDFSATIRRTDKVQPALLIAAIVAAVAFALAAEGWPSAWAWLGAAGFLVTLVASLVVLVPLQRRITASAPASDPAVEAMRSRWFRGHLGRSVLSTASFVSIVLAVTV
jgi:hypothetical protein